MSIRHRILSFLIVIFALVGTSAALLPTHGATEAAPRTLDRLPGDPLAAGLFVVDDPVGVLDYWLDLLAEFSDEGRAGIDEQLKQLDEKLGLSLREDLLSQIGPECAVSFDLSSIDGVIGAAIGGGDGLAQMLEKFLLVVEIHDSEKIDHALQTLVGLAEANISTEEGLVKLHFGGSEDSSSRPVFDMFYRIHKNMLVAGFWPETVREAIEGRPSGTRLTDGADFAHVFSHLDASPVSMSYVNLPKLRSMLQGSLMVQSWIATQPEGQKALDVFMRDEWMGVGMGATSVEVGGGLQTTKFGPTLLSRLEIYRGLSLWTAAPGFLTAGVGELLEQATVGESGPPAAPEPASN